MLMTNLNQFSVDRIVEYISEEVNVTSVGTDQFFEVSATNVVTQVVKSRCTKCTSQLSTVLLT